MINVDIFSFCLVFSAVFGAVLFTFMAVCKCFKSTFKDQSVHVIKVW